MQKQIDMIKDKVKEKNLEVRPPLTENDVRDFELLYKVSLPREYREFLLQVGSGAPGPYYGLLPLDGASIEEIENEKFSGVILPLAHEGCGYYHVLVLTGEETGAIWVDNRAADDGFHKLYYGYGHYATAYTFLDWFEHWLNSGATNMNDILKDLNS
jgi:hypothetical protein